jgi:hypothetical protein
MIFVREGISEPEVIPTDSERTPSRVSGCTWIPFDGANAANWINLAGTRSSGSNGCLYRESKKSSNEKGGHDEWTGASTLNDGKKKRMRNATPGRSKCNARVSEDKDEG